jgi:RNA polymerase sigma factor (sigma-70 family)
LLKAIETDFDITRVLQKVRGLKDEYREVLIMKYLDEMSNGEIASALGKSASHVRVIAHRALQALGETIESNESRPSKKLTAVHKE